MKITYHNGDLFKGVEQIIVHGTNIQGRFASGFAKSVRDRYPAAYITYMNTYYTGNLALGTINQVAQHRRLIVNAATQEFYGTDGRQYVSYDAVRSCFRALNILVEQIQNERIAFEGIAANVDAVALPLIGCGLGGGAWSIISRIIEEESVAYGPVVYLIDGEIPK